METQRMTILDVLSGMDDSPESWRRRARWWRRAAERHARHGRVAQAQRILERVAQMEQRATPCLRLVETPIATTTRAGRRKPPSPAGTGNPPSPAGRPPRRNRMAERLALLRRRTRLAAL